VISVLLGVPVVSRVVSVALSMAACATLAGVFAHAQFETRASFTMTHKDPFSLIVGDFNRDGVPDIAVLTTYPSGAVKILLGNADGTFRPGASYATEVGFYGAAASLRGNGTLDLIFGGAGVDDVYVMLGNGDGTFQLPVAYPVTAGSQMIALGDFTGDGKLDVVDVEGTSSQGVVCDCVEVLPGNGDGTFGAHIATVPVPYNITGVSIVAGDFNNDGKLDLAVGGSFGSTSQVDILLGNGDGTFIADGFYLLGGSPAAIVTGYFTGNRKKIDLALTNGGIDVMLGNGDGTFQQPVFYDGSISSWVIAQDLNGDGKVDLAASNAGAPPQYPPGVTVYHGNGDGTFQAGIFYRVGTNEGGDYVTAGDFNGDRRPDLVVLDSVDGYVTTLLNTGVVSFSPTTPLNFKKQSVGTTSPPQMVSLTNTGSKALKIASMKASAEFGVTSTCGTSVAAGAKCTISVTFSPTQKGTKQGTVTIIDSASTKPQVIEVLGTGT
jgi:hypothetical protein